MAEDLRRNCELCAEEAAVYCPCDAAFLCNACDDKVHRANFLVARHVRVDLCRVCRNFAGKRYSGVGKSSPSKIACESCSPELEKINNAGVEDDDRVSSTSSSCVSCMSSASSRRRRKSAGTTPYTAAFAVDAKVEGILVIWCRKMDINEDDNSGVVREVVEVVSKSMGKMTVLPFRVLLAGAFWSVIRTRYGGELTRLEQISGVPRVQKLGRVDSSRPRNLGLGGHRDEIRRVLTDHFKRTQNRPRSPSQLGNRQSRPI